MGSWREALDARRLAKYKAAYLCAMQISAIALAGQHATYEFELGPGQATVL
jgi:hypothetical protein